MSQIYRNINRQKYEAYHPENPKEKTAIDTFYKQLERTGIGQSMVLGIDSSTHEFRIDHIDNIRTQ